MQTSTTVPLPGTRRTLPSHHSGTSADQELVYRMASCPPGPARETLREQAIRAFLPMARRIARRYGSHADSDEDLYQVACMGLVKAVDRFDPERGHAFLSYAVPTIDGEVRRHLRDSAWDLRVSRALQDKHRRLRAAQEALRRLGHSDGGTYAELERVTGMAEEDVRLALQVDRARRSSSLEEERGFDRSRPLAETLGAEDPALDLVTDLVALRALLRGLPVRERRVLGLYYLESLTQQQVAQAVGLSQMHVSRLIARTCAQLRARLVER
ncbi:sigma-70 family RNA polymerase sigma factor [Streptomyces sp. NPDC015220]|uniref:sigma-70 family RNA polymerase sigma factor n=1 Tax=Streptomyces sp. NPDC015220 TaxID=3364947 RepID=UPI0036FAE663